MGLTICTLLPVMHNFPETTLCGPPPTAMWTMLSSLHMGAMHAHLAQQIGVKMGFHKVGANF